MAAVVKIRVYITLKFGAGKLVYKDNIADGPPVSNVLHPVSDVTSLTALSQS